MCHVSEISLWMINDASEIFMASGEHWEEQALDFGCHDDHQRRRQLQSLALNANSHRRETQEDNIQTVRWPDMNRDTEKHLWKQ